MHIRVKEGTRHWSPNKQFYESRRSGELGGDRLFRVHEIPSRNNKFPPRGATASTRKRYKPSAQGVAALLYVRCHGSGPVPGGKPSRRGAEVGATLHPTAPAVFGIHDRFQLCIKPAIEQDEKPNPADSTAAACRARYSSSVPEDY